MYILQNQNGYFLAKSGAWVDGREPRQLFRTAHKDEAANQRFEATSNDFTLRLITLDCEVSDKGLPLISADLLPPPLLVEDLDNSQESLLKNALAPELNTGLGTEALAC
jgi:hypothetical protein